MELKVQDVLSGALMKMLEKTGGTPPTFYVGVTPLTGQVTVEINGVV